MEFHDGNSTTEQNNKCDVSHLFLRLLKYAIEKDLNEKVCEYRKGHSTVTTLLGIKDMIVQAMGRGEITLMVLADFSKAFDTIDYKTYFIRCMLSSFQTLS